MATAANTPFGLQHEAQVLARKRKMAEMLFQQGLQMQQPQAAPGGIVPKINPLQAIAQVLAGTMGYKQMADLDPKDADLAQRMGDWQQQEIARKTKEEMVKQLATSVGPQSTPQSVQQMIVGQDPSKLQFNTPGLQPTTFNGEPMIIRTDEKGQLFPHFPPKGTSVTVDTIGKAGGKVNEDQGKYFGYGGKGFEKFQDINKQLQSGANLLATLEENVAMGAGGDILQTARKWAQTLGAPVNDQTTPTELAKMQLGQKVLERLGGLGAQVSDADRKFMLDVQGSLGSDPEAVRQLVMLEQKYLMQVAGELSTGRQRMGELFGKDVPLPDYHYQFAIPPRLQQEFERVLLGQPRPPKAPPPPPPAKRVDPTMPSRFKVQ